MIRSVLCHVALGGVLLLTLAAAGAAQESGIYLTGGWSQARFDEEAMAEFNTSYSTFYQQRLSGPVELLPAQASSPVFGAMGRINLGGVAMGIGYTVARAETDNRAMFENQSGNRITSRTLDHYVSTEVTTDALGGLMLGGSFGGAFRGVRIRSAAIHADGSESLGSEYRIAGVYTAAKTYFEMGLIAGLPLGDRVMLPVRVLFPLDVFTDRIAVSDTEVRQLNQYFPRDFARFANDPWGNAESEAALAGQDFVGMRIQFGLEMRVF